MPDKLLLFRTPTGGGVGTFIIEKRVAFRRENYVKSLNPFKKPAKVSGLFCFGSSNKKRKEKGHETVKNHLK